MNPAETLRSLKSREARLAWFVAMAADGIQILLLPFFVAGGLSPADVAVDCAAALLLTRLLGWHWAFLPTALAELFPAFDLFPTWTAAVVYVMWQQRGEAPPPEETPKSLPSSRPYLNP